MHGLRFSKERAEMGFWQSANSILQTVSSNTVETKPKSMEEVILQTAESHLRDEAKIEALKALNNADDWAALQRDDREKVRQYEMAKLPWRKETGGASEEEMGHILGDVTIQQAPNRNPISGLIVPLATIGLIGYIAHEMLNKDVPVPTQTQIEQPIDTDTDTRNSVDVGFGDPVYKNDIKKDD